ncbi:nuclear transport factor 2 family protein [Cupriavidus sp. BIS7]|uniref:nuclear transport factor 2 family protein n=1 Tax=Cupriavidus sp. BIS7 TaxID=1217718 RepID=UPI0003143F66|nr:nuclear transport factor 2 family protein [Cupriavidus sp. BIS7]
MEAMNQSLSIVIAAEQAVTRLYYALDRSDYPGVANCFTPDGIWERPGSPYRGQQEILASLSKRPTTLFTRHYITNFAVLEHGGSVVKATFALTVYRSDKGTPPTLPVGQPVAAMLADVECELACSDSGDWRISHLDPRITFAA